MTSADLRYAIYSATFEELCSAMALCDQARVLHIRAAVARLPCLERWPAEAAVDDAENRWAKRTREEFGREFTA